ncbi:hypothetical protein F5148DRAFT_1151634 [Russula earlei]|uniref:Uncharacterized protein n=1 Tax=Russula earlei TaxID=71964 RepID=A0ACC0U032_9AGAM|nr:hypothetical protein F5148DRAFT_1151634 [Russula earlei]
MVRETLNRFALSKTNIEIGYFVFAAFASAFMLKLLCAECSRFITPELETEVYQVIERLIATIGSHQIAIDDRHPRTRASWQAYWRSINATARPRPVRVRQGTSNHHNHNHHSNSNDDSSRDLPPPLQNTTSSSLSSGVSSNAGAPDLHQSVPQNNGATAPPNFTNAVSTEGQGNYVLEQPPDFMFSVAGQPGELMDFTFDTITTPRNDDLLATMQAIQNPTWWQNMMMPGTCNNLQKDFAAKHTRPGYTRTRTSALTRQPDILCNNPTHEMFVPSTPFTSPFLYQSALVPPLRHLGTPCCLLWYLPRCGPSAF